MLTNHKPYKDRQHSYDRARELRAAGFGYMMIAKQVGVTENTVRYWVNDIAVSKSMARSNADRLKAPTCLSECNTSESRKKFLILKRSHKCEKCLNHTWLDLPITLELEHVDGVKTNNTEENLKLLCPNCHSYTPTWRRKKSSLKHAGMV